MTIQSMFVPNIGDFESVSVIEILIKEGDTLRLDQPVIVVESDKASMEIPATLAGVVHKIRVKLGDSVSEGSLILELAADSSSQTTSTHSEQKTNPTAQTVISSLVPNANPTPSYTATSESSPKAASLTQAFAATATNSQAPAAASLVVEPTGAKDDSKPSLPPHAPNNSSIGLAYASPSVRLFARELGVDLSKVTGTANKGRITRLDVLNFVKISMTQLAEIEKSPSVSGTPAGTSPTSTPQTPGFEVLAWPKIDFSKFGQIERKPMGRIKKIAAANLHRNWVMIPHVTNHEDVDITDLENFRQQANQLHEKSGIKITMLSFLLKAAVSALIKFPEFNASLDGEDIVYKKYYHLGFAADTPQGLVVPVLKDVDKKGILQISAEVSDLARKAREGKLTPNDMSGATFTISSLGGIGGRYFSPIINAPEVAILGVSKNFTQAVWDGQTFMPRLLLPLSLSWDHRILDGASAARFNAHLKLLLADFRLITL